MDLVFKVVILEFWCISEFGVRVLLGILLKVLMICACFWLILFCKVCSGTQAQVFIKGSVDNSDAY